MSKLQLLEKTINGQNATVQFKNALPDHINVKTFQRIAMTALNNAYGIDQCSPQSIMNSLVQCAQDGLLPDNKEAAIVKYKTTAQYMPMVRGVIKKMRNSGLVSDVNAHIVYEHDEFDIEIIDGITKVRHVPKIMGDRGEIVLVYGVVLFKDGEKHLEYMTKADVDKIRSKSQGGGKTTRNGSPTVWEEWYEEMAKKTIIHRLSKRVPCSADFYEFVERDQKIMMQDEDTAEEKSESLIDNINQAVDAEFTESFDNGKDGFDASSQEDKGELVDVPI